MSMINCCVFNYTKNRMILPWKIMSLEVPGVTLKQFYEEKVLGHIQQSSTSNFKLESAFLGQSKSSLDQIELSICLSTAISNYGGYLKYVPCSRSITRSFTSTRCFYNSYAQPAYFISAKSTDACARA